MINTLDEQRTAYKSLLARSWNALAAILPRSLMSPTLSAQDLLRSAQKTAGLTDYGQEDFREALDRLVSSVETTGELDSFGRFYLKQILKRLLIHRLKLVEHWKQYPQILQEKIQKPVFIVGLPRTGTSLLLNLLSLDPAHRVLTNWETTVSQIPPSGRYSFGSDPRRRVGKILILFQDFLAPDLKYIHQFHLDGPEECTPFLMQGFATQALAGLFHVPSYSKWLDDAPSLSTYEHHKRILQTLQATYAGERWLLKSPDHLGGIRSLLEVYPDACIVHTHRDPNEAVVSWSSLNFAFRSLFMRSVDPVVLGEDALYRLSTDMRRYLAERHTCDQKHFFDVHYEDLVGDPLEIIRRIYRHFGLDLSSEFEARVRHYLSKPGARTMHQYRHASFGLSIERIRRDFLEYMEAFDIHSQLDSEKRSGSSGVSSRMSPRKPLFVLAPVAVASVIGAIHLNAPKDLRLALFALATASIAPFLAKAYRHSSSALVPPREAQVIRTYILLHAIPGAFVFSGILMNVPLSSAWLGAFALFFYSGRRTWKALNSVRPSKLYGIFIRGSTGMLLVPTVLFLFSRISDFGVVAAFPERALTWYIAVHFLIMAFVVGRIENDLEP